MSRRVIFLGCLLVELLCVFGLFVPLVLHVSAGTEVTLKTIPVDPRSVFRGDYITLDYEAGRGVPDTVNYGKPVVVVLEKKGEDWVRVSYGDTKPALNAGQICLRGRLQYQRISFPDISQFFVEEGLGKELEQARNAHRLLVTASVTEDCHAVVTGIILGAEAPLENPPEVFSRPVFEDTKPEPTPVR